MARKPLSTKIENNLQKDVKKLAIDLERPLNDLLEEAMRDLLKKYEKKAKKKTPQPIQSQNTEFPYVFFP